MIQAGEATRGLVSVVICAYNNWPDVELTIASALQQSYPRCEVIVVDNSSTDATPQEIRRRFGDRLQYICQPNRGTYGAYNSGLARARGEFIQFIDGDDVLAPNKIAKQIEIFQSDPGLEIVYGEIRRFQSTPGIANWEDYRTQPVDDMLKALITFEIDLSTIGMLFHRQVFDKVGRFDESLWVGDYDFWLRAAHAGCRFAYCPGAVMGFYRQHAGQMTKDVSATQRGFDDDWRKALGYVTSEPHRSLIVQGLADSAFHQADVVLHRTVMRSGNLTRQEALAELAVTRAAWPEFLTPTVYAIGWLAIVLPGGAALFRSRSLQAIRQVFGRLLFRRPVNRERSRFLIG